MCFELLNTENYFVFKLIFWISNCSKQLTGVVIQLIIFSVNQKVWKILLQLLRWLFVECFIIKYDRWRRGWGRLHTKIDSYFLYSWDENIRNRETHSIEKKISETIWNIQPTVIVFKFSWKFGLSLFFLLTVWLL